MTIAVPQLTKLAIIDTFKKVKSIRETSVLCKVARNTVRKILREKGIDGMTRRAMIISGKQQSDLSKIPKLNDKSSWSPSAQELYKQITKIQEQSPLCPRILSYLDNQAKLCQKIANETAIGDSTVGTFKLSLFHKCYSDYIDSTIKAAAVFDDHMLSLEQKTKLSMSLKKAGYLALDRALALLGDLEGKSSISKMHMEQNNYTINVEDT